MRQILDQLMKDSQHISAHYTDGTSDKGLIKFYDDLGLVLECDLPNEPYTKKLRIIPYSNVVFFSTLISIPPEDTEPEYQHWE